jgi:hypothetical protein
MNVFLGQAQKPLGRLIFVKDAERYLWWTVIAGEIQ